MSNKQKLDTLMEKIKSYSFSFSDEDSYFDDNKVYRALEATIEEILGVLKEDPSHVHYCFNEAFQILEGDDERVYWSAHRMLQLVDNQFEDNFKNDSEFKSKVKIQLRDSNVKSFLKQGYLTMMHSLFERDEQIEIYLSLIENPDEDLLVRLKSTTVLSIILPNISEDEAKQKKVFKALSNMYKELQTTDDREYGDNLPPGIYYDQFTHCLKESKSDYEMISKIMAENPPSWLEIDNLESNIFYHTGVSKSDMITYQPEDFTIVNGEISGAFHGKRYSKFKPEQDLLQLEISTGRNRYNLTYNTQESIDSLMQGLSISEYKDLIGTEINMHYRDVEYGELVFGLSAIVDANN